MFEIVRGRIETLSVDAVVNAANRWLSPGGGVDGAIRRAAGPALNAHLESFPGLEEGGALLTPGFALPARYVIHTVAPIWIAPGDESVKDAGLVACYRNTLTAADAAGVASIAYPALGTGAFGWPKPRAAEIAIRTLTTTAERATNVTRIVLCCFLDEDALLYEALLG